MDDKPILTLPGLVATVGGVGAVPKAPGTAGSAVAAIAALWIPFNFRVGLIAVLFVIGVWAAGAYETAAGRTDPGEVVIDEVVGQLIATLGHVAGTGLNASAANFIVPAFILFRFFDILKPWPISACERAPKGLGIMLDDVVAGIFANIVLWGLRKVFIEGWWPF